MCSRVFRDLNYANNPENINCCTCFKEPLQEYRCAATALNPCFFFSCNFESILFWHFRINMRTGTFETFLFVERKKKKIPQTLFRIGSHLRQIDCLYLPSDSRTWTCMPMSLSVCLVRLHPLTLNSPDGGSLFACVSDCTFAVSDAARVLTSIHIQQCRTESTASPVQIVPDLRIWATLRALLTNCHSSPDKC